MSMNAIDAMIKIGMQDMMIFRVIFLLFFARHCSEYFLFLISIRLCSLNFDYFCYHTKLIDTTREKIKYALERLDEFKDLIDDYEYKDVCYWLNLLNKQTSED